LILDQLKKLFGKKPKSEFAFEAGNKGPLSLKSMFNPQSWDYMVKQIWKFPTLTRFYARPAFIGGI